jgi:hypothetical protein
VRIAPNTTLQPSAGSEFLAFHLCYCPRRLNVEPLGSDGDHSRPARFGGSDEESNWNQSLKETQT